MTNHVFAHSIGRIDFMGGTVRLELVTLMPGEAGGGPIASPLTAVYMPLEGFLQSVSTMEQLVKRMADGGLIRIAASADAPA